MTNHDIDASNNFMTPNMYRAAGYTALALGVVVTGNVIVNTFQSDPEYDIKNRADLSAPVVVELPTTSEQDNSAIEFRPIEEGEATSIAVQDAVVDYSSKYHVSTKKGQAGIIQENADSIDYAIKATTGGSVQPGTELKTWLDPNTGYILTTYVADSVK